jgi:hypothetical protein
LSQLIGDGFATPNITDPHEESCLRDATPEEMEIIGSWQMLYGTKQRPVLKLVFCDRSNLTYRGEMSNVVFFAAIQRKHLNHWDLPIRYERYFVI